MHPGLALLASVLSLVLHPVPSFNQRHHLVDASLHRGYATWSAAEGSYPGARALLVYDDSVVVETLTVRWVADDISALDTAPDLGFWNVAGDTVSARLPIQEWRLDRFSVVAVEASLGHPSGSLAVPIGAIPTTFDPAQSTSLADKQVGTQIFEGLTRIEPKPRLMLVARPALADLILPRDSVWTFRLRPGARYHDGRFVHAEDVVASLERALAPATRAPRIDRLLDDIAGARDYHEGRTPNIRGLSAPDTNLVVIVAARRDAPLDLTMACPAAWVMPADVAHAPAFAFRPVGSGPFRLAHADGKGVLLVAAAGRTSGVDTLLFRCVASPQDAALQFELGRLDVVAPSVEDEARLLATRSGPLPEDLTVRLHEDDDALYYLGMNTRSPWLAERAHRRALAAAIDRRLVVRVLVPNRGALPNGLLPHGMYGDLLPDNAWAPEPAEADLLAHAPPPGALELWIPEGTASGERVAEFVQASLARHGVRVRIVKRAWSEFVRGVEAGRADLFYLSWFAEDIDPVRFVRSLVGTASRGAGGNRTYYSNAVVDSLLDRAADAAHPEGREAAFASAMRTALVDLPLLPLFESQTVVLTRPGVRGLVLDPLGCPRYDTVEVPRGR